MQKKKIDLRSYTSICVGFHRLYVPKLHLYNIDNKIETLYEAVKHDKLFR